MEADTNVSVEVLPQKYRRIFSSFTHFNKVQSSVYDRIFDSDDTLVICSPTGSGKTVLLELAIIHEMKKIEKSLFNLEQHSRPFRDLHVIYFCPLKALVAEKLREWSEKFAPFQLGCFDLTGDTAILPSFCQSELERMNILLVTPEKFDYCVRTNQSFRKFISLVQLVLIDEIHTLADKNRGDVLEATITRIKTLRKSKGCTIPLRFIGVSATAPNVDDIALWLDCENGRGINVDPNFRPVKLEKIVLAYDPGRINQNSEYRFDIMLSYHIEDLIRKHSNNKPTLIFCSTRKSVEFTAKVLGGCKFSFFQNIAQRNQLEQESMQFAKHRFPDCDDKLANGFYEMFSNPLLKEALRSGIAIHHLGLPCSDRSFVEHLFSKSLLPVLICTSSLAMGVNLPAHLVIIKNTVFYNSGTAEEYDTSQMLQMIGRAGRPQFDTEAKAIIMTKFSKRSNYQNLLTSNSLVESNLHQTLMEQLTVEIVLRTVNSISEALDWISSSFLFRRIVSNPKYYGSKIKEGDFESARPIMFNWCQDSVKKLLDINLIKVSKTDRLEPTKLAKIVVKHSMSIESFESIMQFIRQPFQIENLLEKLSSFQEITRDVVLRTSDKTYLNQLNKDIPFKIDGRIKTVEAKINCITQSVFSCLTLDQCLIRDSTSIQRSGIRVIKCFVDILEHLCSSTTTYQNRLMEFFWLELCSQTLISALMLLKCFKTKLWHDSPYVAKQLKNIGIVFSKKLVARGLDTFEKLVAVNPRDIEFCVKRNPPFGGLVQNEIKNCPKYHIAAFPNSSKSQVNFTNVKFAALQEFVIEVSVELSDVISNSVLKPNEHRIGIIISCDSCDRVILFQRMTDVELKHSLFKKTLFVIQTNIMNNEDNESTGNSQKTRDKPSESRKITVQPKVDCKKELSGFASFFNDMMKKQPQHMFHCCFKNNKLHLIKVRIISESFVGIDVEHEFKCHFRTMIQLTKKKTRKNNSINWNEMKAQSSQSDVDEEERIDSEQEITKRLPSSIVSDSQEEQETNYDELLNEDFERFQEFENILNTKENTKCEDEFVPKLLSQDSSSKLKNNKEEKQYVLTATSNEKTELSCSGISSIESRMTSQSPSIMKEPFKHRDNLSSGISSFKRFRNIDSLINSQIEEKRAKLKASHSGKKSFENSVYTGPPLKNVSVASLPTKLIVKKSPYFS